MIAINNLEVVNFTTYISDSDGEPVEGTQRERYVLYNNTHLSQEEVDTLIRTGKWKYDLRLFEITLPQLKFFLDKDFLEKEIEE